MKAKIEALRRAITLKELARDLHPADWNRVAELELADLKAEWARLTNRDWRGA